MFVSLCASFLYGTEQFYYRLFRLFQFDADRFESAVLTLFWRTTLIIHITIHHDIVIINFLLHLMLLVLQFQHLFCVKSSFQTKECALLYIFYDVCWLNWLSTKLNCFIKCEGKLHQSKFTLGIWTSSRSISYWCWMWAWNFKFISQMKMKSFITRCIRWCWNDANNK